MNPSLDKHFYLDKLKTLTWPIRAEAVFDALDLWPWIKSKPRQALLKNNKELILQGSSSSGRQAMLNWGELGEHEDMGSYIKAMKRSLA